MQVTFMPDRVTRMREQILSGPINASVLRLAWPVAASNFLQTVFTLVDGIWVGRLGPEALAGVSTGGFFIWAIFALMGMVSVGVNALVAQAVGANDDERAAHVAGQGLVLSCVVGVVITVAGLAGIEYLFQFMQTDDAVTTLGTAYLSTYLLGVPVLFALFTITAVFSGAGDTQTTMRLSGGAIIIALVLDPILIYGFGPIPGFGVVGAALATVISRSIFLVIGLVMLKRRTTGVGITLHRSFVLPDIWRNIIRIGGPTSIANMTHSVVYIFLTRITTSFGTPAVAALGACHRLEGISYMLAVGFSAAAAAYVGQNLGAGQPDRAERGAWRSSVLVCIPNGVLVTLFMTVPQILLLAFTDDPAVIEIGSWYLRIVGISMLLQSIDLVLEGAFSGAGNTMPPMAIGAPASILRYPIAILFAGAAGLGVNGVWLSISVTSVVRALLMMYWFSRGTWKTFMKTLHTGAISPD